MVQIREPKLLFEPYLCYLSLTQVKLRIIEYIHLKGMENVSMDDIIKATAVKARYMVPENIVKELQQEVKNYRNEKR